MIGTLVDSDVFIWYLRGNPKAKEAIETLGPFAISCVTHMELVQGMRDKRELRLFQQTLKQWQTKTIYISEEISARALFYVEEYFLSHSMQLADALIAATATTHGLTLLAANDKHYRTVRELDLALFRPA